MSIRTSPSGPLVSDQGSLITNVTAPLRSAQVAIAATQTQLTDPVQVPAGFTRCHLSWSLGCFNTVGFNGAPMAFILALQINGASPSLNLGQYQWRVGGPGENGGDIRSASLDLSGLSEGDEFIFFANENQAAPYGAGRTRLVNAPLAQDGYTRFNFMFWEP